MAKGASDSKAVVVKLKAILERTGLAQYELAQKIGCPPATLNRWIMGKVGLSQAWRKVIETLPEMKKLFYETQ